MEPSRRLPTQPVVSLSCCTSLEGDPHWEPMWLQLWESQLGTGTTIGLRGSRDARVAGSELMSLAASKAHKGKVQMAGAEAPALLPPMPRRSGCCQSCGCLSATPLMVLGKQGAKDELLFSGTCSRSYLCLLVVFGLCHFFFLPISVTDASGIFPGHIHLAASSCC